MCGMLEMIIFLNLMPCMLMKLFWKLAICFYLGSHLLQKAPKKTKGFHDDHSQKSGVFRISCCELWRGANFRGDSRPGYGLEFFMGHGEAFGGSLFFPSCCVLFFVGFLLMLYHILWFVVFFPFLLHFVEDFYIVPV